MRTSDFARLIFSDFMSLSPTLSISDSKPLLPFCLPATALLFELFAVKQPVNRLERVQPAPSLSRVERNLFVRRRRRNREARFLLFVRLVALCAKAIFFAKIIKLSGEHLRVLSVSALTGRLRKQVN